MLLALAVTPALTGCASAHASHSLDRAASLVTVRDTLGYAGIATTNKYLHGKRSDSSALHLAV